MKLIKNNFKNLCDKMDLVQEDHRAEQIKVSKKYDALLDNLQNQVEVIDDKMEELRLKKVELSDQIKVTQEKKQYDLKALRPDTK